MKILHIIDSGGLYGAEVMLLHHVAEQMKQGLESIIASIGEKGIREKSVENEALKRGFKVKKFRMHPGPNVLGALDILKYAWSERVDILHSHGYKGNILLGLIPKRTRKIPMVTTVHGYTSTGNGISRMRLYEWLDSRALRFMDAVMFVSEAMKSGSRFKHLESSRGHVIHNGIPISENQFNDLINQQFDKEILDFCSKGFTIGTIGRLSIEKGYEYLLEAFSIVIQNGINARLVIIGDGGERRKLEDLRRQLGLSDRVLLPGYQNNAKKYLPFFDVFVISSLTEGLPITLLEAMHSRVPIAATTVGGIPEIITNGETGMLFPTCSPQYLAEAVISLYRNRNIGVTLSNNAHTKLVAECSCKIMASKYLDIYEEIAGSLAIR